MRKYIVEAYQTVDQNSYYLDEGFFSKLGDRLKNSFSSLVSPKAAAAKVSNLASAGIDKVQDFTGLGLSPTQRLARSDKNVLKKAYAKNQAFQGELEKRAIAAARQKQQQAAEKDKNTTKALTKGTDFNQQLDDNPTALVQPEQPEIAVPRTEPNLATVRAGANIANNNPNIINAKVKLPNATNSKATPLAVPAPQTNMPATPAWAIPTNEPVIPKAADPVVRTSIPKNNKLANASDLPARAKGIPAARPNSNIQAGFVSPSKYKQQGLVKAAPVKPLAEPPKIAPKKISNPLPGVAVPKAVPSLAALNTNAAQVAARKRGDAPRGPAETIRRDLPVFQPTPVKKPLANLPPSAQAAKSKFVRKEDIDFNILKNNLTLMEGFYSQLESEDIFEAIDAKKQSDLELFAKRFILKG